MLFVSAVAAMVLAGSCQQELNPVTDGDTTVTFTVSAGDIATKAIADGTNIDALHWEIYKTAELQSATQPLGENKITDNDGDKNFTVELKLLADQNYTIIFWAEVDGEGHYVTTDLRNVKINDYTDEMANDESRAAFFAVYPFSTENGVAINETVELHRPFSQINLGSTTYETSFNLSEALKVETTEMTVTKVATSFNTLTGEGEGEQEITFQAAPTPNGTSDETQKILEVNGLYYYWLGMNYLIVNGEADAVDVAITLDTNHGEVNHTVTNVPIKENYRTNLLGDFLTTGATFNVVVDENFNVNDYVVENDANYLSISSAEELAKVATEIANGNTEYTNIILGGDIDLAELAQTRSAESNWTPIGTPEVPFTGVFNGKGYTIKNLNLVETEAKEGKAYIGFFGYAKNATIKNVTFENVNVNVACLDIDHSQGHIGAVAGSLEGTSTIENVTVKGNITVESTVTANGASRVAVVAGGNAFGDVTMKNVHVIANEGSYLKANNNVGALAGQLQGKNVFENCSSNIDVTGTKFFAGGIIGLAAGDSQFTDCHTTGNVAVTAGREGRNHDQYRVGGIAGGWADGATKVCTLTDCSYTGTISGKNSDGSVASPLDYLGYVGRGYTLNGCQGSKVIIDGVEFVQKYNTAAEAGVYVVNGYTPVTTADELVAALEANEGVIFMNDIKIEPANMSNAYGTTGINIKNGQTIDGNGYTLNIKGAGGTWDSGINTTGGLIKNLTVTGSFRGIFINHTSTHSEKVVLENVTITGTTYTLSCDQGLYQGIEATNCTFNGWTSYAKTAGEAKFVNCSFGEGNGYKYCRPYSNTEFVECTFCPGYSVDETKATVTYTNCTFEE